MTTTSRSHLAQLKSAHALDLSEYLYSLLIQNLIIIPQTFDISPSLSRPLLVRFFDYLFVFSLSPSPYALSFSFLCLSFDSVPIFFYIFSDLNFEYAFSHEMTRNCTLLFLYLLVVLLCRSRTFSILVLRYNHPLSIPVMSSVDSHLHVDRVVRESHIFDSVRSPMLRKSHVKIAEYLSKLDLEIETLKPIGVQLKLIEFPAKTWQPINQFQSRSIINPKQFFEPKEMPILSTSKEILNLNCVRLRNGIKSLRIRQKFTAFELPLTSYVKKMEPYLTVHVPTIKKESLIENLLKIYRQRDLRHLAQFIPMPQPHTNLDLEIISNRLNNDSYKYLNLSEPIEDGDTIIEVTSRESMSVFTAYKSVAKKVKPVPTTFPQDCNVRRQVPEDPDLSLPDLPLHPPEFTPTKKISDERLKILKINETGFMLPEKEKLFKHIMVLNEDAIAFEDAERGTFKESYFSPYIIPTIPHVPWTQSNIPIPPGLRTKVMEVLKLKIEAGVYKQSSASYRSRWFVVLKKNGKLRIVHDLQPLNKVTIKDAGMLPIVDDFVDGFAGRQCYTVFDLFWGFDARKIHPKSRDLTAFMTPLGLLQITSLPTGFTNSPAEFQKCMAIILKDEMPDIANIFIDDLPIKGPETQYLNSNGEPEVLIENPGIRRFIWEHAQDVHRIMHKVKTAGATFAANKAQICQPEVLIIGQTCNAAGRSPDTSKVEKILTWPTLTEPKEVRQFLGLCGTVRIWIPQYSEIIRPLTELYRKNIEFIWDERRQLAFDKMKLLIASAPALRPIDYTSENPVVISVDSSKIAVGMILSQLSEDGKTKYPARYGSLPMDEPASRYSQAKLELFGLYRALRHWRLYIIGVKNLIVEVDAKYIKGMLNEPDISPNATLNRWIQGINLFTFELVHVPAERHRGPDALSRRPLAEGETIEEEDDTWLDDITLLAQTTSTPTQEETPDSE